MYAVFWCYPLCCCHRCTCVGVVIYMCLSGHTACYALSLCLCLSMASHACMHVYCCVFVAVPVCKCVAVCLLRCGEHACCSTDVHQYGHACKCVCLCLFLCLRVCVSECMCGASMHAVPQIGADVCLHVHSHAFVALCVCIQVWTACMLSCKCTQVCTHSRRVC